MPIEIREMVIRTQIVEEDRLKKISHTQRPVNEKEIIDRCVEKILKKLNKKMQR